MQDVNNEIIAVFDQKELSSIIDCIGISKIGLPLNRLRKITTELKREHAEKSLNLVQLVSVFIIIANKEVLVFKKTKKAPEKRLHHKYSTIFGGHILWYDLQQTVINVGHYQPNHINLFLRELNEEINFSSPPNISYEGMLYIDNNEVSKQHLGIIYIVECEKQHIHPSEKSQLFKIEFMNKNTFRENLEHFDDWSKEVFYLLEESLLA